MSESDDDKAFAAASQLHIDKIVTDIVGEALKSVAGSTTYAWLLTMLVSDLETGQSRYLYVSGPMQRNHVTLGLITHSKALVLTDGEIVDKVFEEFHSQDLHKILPKVYWPDPSIEIATLVINAGKLLWELRYGNGADFEYTGLMAMQHTMLLGALGG